MARYNSALTSNTITGTATIGSPYSGAFTEFTGTAPYTVTLPTPVAFPGVTQTFYNATSGTVTLSTPAGNFVGTGSTSATTIPIYSGNVISIVSDGSNYVVISEDGSPLIATTGSFSGNVTINGGSATLSVTPSVVTMAPTASSTIDNIAIGPTTRASGAFTTLTANNAVTFTANTASSSTTTGSLVVTGGIGASGTVYAGAFNGNLTGTLQTAAQTNITSVGSLSSLTVTGVLAVDTNTIYVDSTNHRLGVGTNSPAAPLHVIGSDARFGSGQFPVLTIYPTVNSAIFGLRLDGAVSSNGRDWRLEQGRSANGQLNITDITAGNLIRLMIDANGNVGVGTSSPLSGVGINLTLSQSLALGVSSATTGDIISAGGGNNSTYNGIAIVSNSRGLAGVQANTGLSSWIVDIGGRGGDGTTFNVNTVDTFRIARAAAGGTFYGATEVLRINNTGNVGIGITSPQARLELNDTASYNSSNYGQIKHLVLSRSENTRYNAYAGFGDQHGANTFGWRFGTVNNSTDYPTLYMINGKVGIATTAEPVTPLQISSAISMASSGSVVDVLSLTDNDGVTSGVTGARIGLTISAQSGIADRRIGIYATANAANFNTPDIAFWASAQGVAYREITRISAANGFLGLGTGANPSAKLHVVASTPTGLAGVPSGSSVIVDSSSNNYITFRNSADNSTNAGLVFQDNNAGGYLIFRNYDAGGATSDRMFLAGYQGVNIQYGSADSTDVTARTNAATFDSTGVFWEKRKLVYSQDIAAPTSFSANTWFRLSGYNFNNALDADGTQPGWIIQIRFSNLNPSYGYIHWVTAEIPPLSSNTYTGYQGGYTSSHYGNTSVYSSLVFNSTHHTSAGANHDIRLKLDSPSNYDVMNLYIWSNVGNSASSPLTYRVWKI